MQLAEPEIGKEKAQLSLTQAWLPGWLPWDRVCILYWAGQTADSLQRRPELL